MGSKTWADQWGTGNEDEYEKYKVSKAGGTTGGKKMEVVKAAASKGMGKAKTVAVISAKKVKRGTSIGIKWVKNKCQKRFSSSSK